MTPANLPPLRFTHQWAYSNYGIVQGIEPTRRAAIREVEKLCGQPWKKCKRYIEIRKVTIVEGWT